MAIKQVPFTQVYNEVLNDETLSLKAKGLFAYIQSKPENWKFWLQGVVNQSKDGKDSVNGGLRELEETGYLRRTQTRSETGQKAHNEYDLSYNRQFSNGTTPKAENPTLGNPTLENPTLGNPPYSNTILLSNTKEISNTNKNTVLSDENTASDLAKPKNKKTIREDQFEKAWVAFGRIGVKKKAKPSFLRLTEEQLDRVRHHMPRYVANTNTNGVFPSRAHFSSYLNGEYYENEVQVMEVKATTKKGNNQTSRETYNKPTGAFA